MSSSVESISISDDHEQDKDGDAELYGAGLKLSADILLIIFKIIASDTSDKELNKKLATLCFVCKAWKEVAQPLLYSYPLVTNVNKMVQFFRCISKYHHLRSHVKGLFLDETGDMDKYGDLINQQTVEVTLERFWPYFDNYIGLLNSDFNLKTLGISSSLVGRVSGNFYCKKLDLDTLILTHPNGLSSTKITNLSARNVIVYGCFHVWASNVVTWYNLAYIDRMENLTLKVGSLESWGELVFFAAKVLNHRHHKVNKPPLHNLEIRLVPSLRPGTKEAFQLLDNNGLFSGAQHTNVVKWKTFNGIFRRQEHLDWENFNCLNSSNPANHAHANNNKDGSFSLNRAQ